MELIEIARNFPAIGTGKIYLTPITDGLINTTYLVEAPEISRKFILQKINTAIFKNPLAIAENHQLVYESLGRTTYPKKRVRQLPAAGGGYLVAESATAVWRATEFVEGATTLHKADHPETAFEAAQTLSEFLFYLNQDPREAPAETLPGFIDFGKRMRDYQAALATAAPERQQQAAAEIAQVSARQTLPDQWLAWEQQSRLPRRIIHGDPKISNVLFDQHGKGLCVIDLDTVMPGTLLYDFGDMARSYTNCTTEDDAHHPRVFAPDMYRAVKRGFERHLRPLLTPLEAENLDYAAQTVIFIQAVRFLTDYLGGDTYYTTRYAGQNLDRAKNQLNLLHGLEDFLAETKATP